jgi:hypothetical protein
LALNSYFIITMLQNRVDPKGHIIATSARGAWLGNRGQLHGSGKTILRPFKHQAWIICLLQFKGRRREVMSPNLWTELFFLDEATAFAAGHRPCFECRRDDANRFKAAWLKGNPQFGFDRNVAIAKIDAVIHAERIAKDGSKVTFDTAAPALPDGVFIELGGEPYLVAGAKAYLWMPFGYGESKPLPGGLVTVLTPKSVVETLRAGYVPQMGLLL